MIALPMISPDATILAQLDAWQRTVDQEATYSNQVAAAQLKWVANNRRGNLTFDEIKRLLTEMSSGGQRCHYCEDSLAHQVEHIWPKSLYPQLTFSWMNYLYSCGACNNEKQARFAVFEQLTGELTIVSRKKGDPLNPPPSGAAVFIDPRIEDPMRVLKLDLLGTFMLLPMRGLSRLDTARAKYTVSILPINSSPLLKQRKCAYGNYLARLKEYVAESLAGASRQRLTSLRRAMIGLDHPTVFREMQRQNNVIESLRPIFQKIPEALAW